MLQAIRRAERSPLGAPEYAFLVEIEGLDPDTVPFNSLYFTLLDDQDFRYDAASGRQQPELRFGDLPKGRKVKGWLTFSGPETAAHLELEFAPVFALEPVYVRVRLP